MTAITRTALDAGFRGGIDVRVSLRAGAGDGNSAFDGAWFPRTRDLSVELPELIAELDRRGVRVERFTYALDAWAPAARKLLVGDRIVEPSRDDRDRGCQPLRHGNGRDGEEHHVYVLCYERRHELPETLGTAFGIAGDQDDIAPVHVSQLP